MYKYIELIEQWIFFSKRSVLWERYLEACREHRGILKREKGQESEITQIALLMFKDAVLALFLVIIIMYVSEKSHVKNLNMGCQREQAVNLFDLVKIHNKRRARIIREISED